MAVRARSLISVVVALALAATITHAVPARAARCGPGARPEPGLQGQVPVADRINGSAAAGYWCNLSLVGSFASRSFANFDTYRHCAYYTDNIGFFPGAEGGGVVLDVSDPSHPVKTDYLTSRAMGNGGETLRVNQTRGLLVAAYYNALGGDSPQLTKRWLAVYSVKEDCAHPRLLADVELPTAVGHGGCFQPDGTVYYMSSGGSITPIDLTDPSHPVQLSEPWQLLVHDCSISSDGNRGFFASLFGSMYVVDTSQAQRHVAGAGYTVVSTFPTPDVQVQQETVPLYYGGHPYVLLWSEIRLPPKACIPGVANFGYPRIIDIGDDTNPVEVSKLETEVVRPENCAAVSPDAQMQTTGLSKGDAGYPIVSLGFLYDSHMCTPDRLQDPTIVACAQLGSGLRVWDIRDPLKPHEIAYYNTATVSPSDVTLDWAFARPVIRTDLREVWWVTNLEGFHVAKFRRGVWPFPGEPACPPGYDYFRAQYDLVYQACKS